MASNIPIYDQISQQIGSRRFDKVLLALFVREREANRGDEKDYDRMIAEIEVRVEHRHAILLELEKFGSYQTINEALHCLKLAQQEDLDEIALLTKRRQACLCRATEKSRTINKLMTFK
ncbi:hypothetical protein CTI12_AA128770 [Artemisia annua]|uniref:Uncharacterized protein n=1 Tax=Artemisia annua TaxID=35608 RepID=A0A2U1NLT3_ARTAN|nr:hypothetical protein CTI12_AA128770 [Artemisia annua]